MKLNHYHHCHYCISARPQDWDAALDEFLKLKEAVDSNTFTPVLQQMQQRTWLMHWGLYIFFNHENGRNLIIDHLFQDRCCITVCISSLWMGIARFSSFTPLSEQ